MMLSTPDEQLVFIRSLMWINDFEKLFFTDRRTDAVDKEEYYWFSYTIATDERKHHTYYMSNKGVYITYGTKIFRYKLLMGNLRDIGYTIIQMTDIEDTHTYVNYMGVEIPEKRNSTRYIIDTKTPTSV